MGGVASAVGAGLGLVSALIGNRQAKKAEKRAAAAQREAALHNVQVGRNDNVPTQTQSDMSEQNELNRQNAAKRRQGLSSTIRGGGLVSSLTSGRKTLG